MTVMLILTEPSRNEVLLVRKRNPLGPLQYGLLGQSWDAVEGSDHVPTMLAESVREEWLALAIARAIDPTPLVCTSTCTVMQAIAKDWKEWRHWSYAALQGALCPDAFWLPIYAVKRLLDPYGQAHTCYEREPRSPETVVGIQAFVRTIKALEMARARFAGPNDIVRLRGKVLEVEVPDVKQFDKQKAKAKGILPWLPTGMSVEVVLGETSGEGAMA